MKNQKEKLQIIKMLEKSYDPDKYLKALKKIIADNPGLDLQPILLR
jgi:hypothetical protein